jgi:hypothetical protein
MGVGLSAAAPPAGHEIFLRSAKEPRRRSARLGGMGVLVQFPARGPWNESERKVLAELQRIFRQKGVHTDCEHGRADDGTPWTAFYDIKNGSFVAHIARHGHNYVLLWPDRTAVRVLQMTQLADAVTGDASAHLPMLRGRP